jgi:hypothetical protein
MLLGMARSLEVGSKSAHHGYINYENQLPPFKGFFQRYPDVEIVEVDFVYSNGKFISAHDYTEATVKLGSELEEWIRYIVRHNKIMWIDVKDTMWSVISNRFSSFNVEAFYKTLDDISTRVPNVSSHVLISCQYTNTYNRLVAMRSNYTIIHDMPQDFAYALNDFLPRWLIKSYVQRAIVEALRGVDGIVCLDSIFFSSTLELNGFIQDLTQKRVIVYSYPLNETNTPTSSKQIFVQFDYYL